MSQNTKLDFRAKTSVFIKNIWHKTKCISKKVWESTKRISQIIWKNAKDISKKAYGGFMSAKTFWSAFAILVILLIISIVVLSIRLHDYTKVDDRSVSLRSSMDETLNVFAMEYQNDSGEVTIKGQDGEKVVAPGCDVEYTLRLRNTDKVALDYSFTPDIKYTSIFELPIVVRLIDPDDNYIIGDETTWVPLEEIGNAECSGTLMQNETAEYVFQWKWPFESGDDKYDSFLGSANLDGDIGVDLSFGLHAEANTTVDANGGFFSSHQGRISTTVIIAILLAIAIALLLVYIIRKRDVAEPVIIEAPIVQIDEAPVAEETPQPIFIEPWSPAPAFYGKMATINIDTIDAFFNSGDVITINALKAKGLIPKSAKQMKILARSAAELKKAFIIETQGISKHAEAAICRAGGRVIITAPDKGDTEL